ncbi:FAD-binding oxidoreductase [Nonomuraea typhae]|uniref:FAD-binding oxidoreductase n=1 Tax=Nonomuraea typhae TaxID=2603600 RepID=UPI001C670030|nr:FAD-binding oxidoreductase [Nonomuraea typhae]
MISRRSFLQAGAAVALGGAGMGTAGDGLVRAAPATAARSRSGTWDRLRQALHGDLVRPGDKNYDLARQLALASFDRIRPQGVAYCADARDVQTCLRFVQDNSLPLAVRSGGHNFGGWSTGEGLVLDVSRLNHVRAGRGTVTLGTGAQAIDTLAALERRNVQVAAGICPTVCPGGFIQGGGVGWHTRKFGMACDLLVSAQVVLADGRVVRCSAESEPDLFWALRGGTGGNFGVVTEFEVRHIPMPRLTNYNVAWTWDDAIKVIPAYQQWIIDGPDDLGANMTVQLNDAAPGKVPLVYVWGAWLGEPGELKRHLDALVAAVGRRPTGRTAETLPYGKAMRQVWDCADKTDEQCHRVGYNPEAVLPRFGYGVDRGRLTDRAMPEPAVAEALAVFDSDRRPGQYRYLTFFAFGGRANRVPRTATAYVHRTSQYYIGFTAGLPGGSPGEEDRLAAEDWGARGFALADRNSNGETFQNFPDPRISDWRAAYYAENYPRLVEVKRRYDPHGLFRYAQAIGR